jgi:DNA-binding response OmpR family regulator
MSGRRSQVASLILEQTGEDSGSLVDDSWVTHIVLIVEDDPDIGAALCRVIGEAGYATHLATDGRTALTELRRPEVRLPCLILLDLMMPVMDGFQFLAARERESTLASVPVIVMTAGPTLGLSNGVPVLRKPIRLARLLAELDSQLRPGCIHHRDPVLRAR